MEKRQLVFALRTWQGQYASWDVPGGVKTTATESAVYRVSEDGGELSQMKVAAPNPQFPRCSPEGRWIYFQAPAADGRWHIFRCRPDGSEERNLTESHALGRDSFGCDFSADGARLVYVVHDGQIGRVAVMNADGSQARIVAPAIGYHYMASFSPEGRRIVFSHTADGYRMKVMDLEGGIVANLTPEHPESFCGRFTPDGSRIVFFRRDGDIYRVDADGKDLRRLTQGNRYGQFKISPNDAHGSSDPPSISPDGRQVAYCARADGAAQAHAMASDGGGQRRLTGLDGGCGRVTWSPDGRRIAFVSFVRGRPQLFVMDADGGHVAQRTDLPGAVYSLDWQP